MGFKRFRVEGLFLESIEQCILQEQGTSSLGFHIEALFIRIGFGVPLYIYIYTHIYNYIKEPPPPKQYRNYYVGPYIIVPL